MTRDLEVYKDGAVGDLYYRDANGQLLRLPIGAFGQVLTVSSAGVPAWGTVASDPSTGVGGIGNPWNDEFDVGTVLDITGARFSGANAWTKFNTGVNFIRADVSGGALVIETSSNGTSLTPRGGYQSVPTGDWTFVLDVSIPLPGGAIWDMGAGLYLAESATGKQLLPMFGCNFGNYCGVRSTVSGTYAGSFTPSSGAGLLEIKRVGVNISARAYQGGTWTTIMAATAQTVDFTTAPDRIGLFVACRVAAGTNDIGTFQSFRRTA